MRVHNICSCGCSKLVVPAHLQHEPLAVSVALTRQDLKFKRQTVSFTITYENQIDDKGWKDVGSKKKETNQGGESTTSCQETCLSTI